MPIKELLINIYRANGMDVMTAAQYAIEYMEALKREHPGTVWNLNSPAEGKTYSIRRN